MRTNCTSFFKEIYTDTSSLKNYAVSVYLPVIIICGCLCEGH